MESTQNLLYGKTLQELCQATKEKISGMLLKKSQKVKFQYLDLKDGQNQVWLEVTDVMWSGEYLMHNIGECPNQEKESYLWQILEPIEEVAEKYYLSPKGCQGILRRAKEMKKQLPQTMKIALEQQEIGRASCRERV